VTFIESVLWPLTLPYGAGVHLRARAYRKGILRQRRLGGMVISVGNLTTGGTGKTPMVIWIAQRLLVEGKSTGILTRGYRGEGNASALTSDEVRLMQARLGDRVAFGVGADRFAGGSELAKRGVESFVLDDGFQHLQLARDADIVLIDAMNPFGGGHLLPAGRLREPPSALSRADIVVITLRLSRLPSGAIQTRRFSTRAPTLSPSAHIAANILGRNLRKLTRANCSHLAGLAIQPGSAPTCGNGVSIPLVTRSSPITTATPRRT